jgi:hypothetical protein
MMDKETGYPTKEEEEELQKAKQAEAAAAKPVADPQNATEATVATIQETQKMNTCLTVAAAALLIASPPLGAVALATTGAAAATMSATEGVVTNNPAQFAVAVGSLAAGAVAGRVAVGAAGLTASEFNWGASRYISSNTGRFVTASTGAASMTIMGLSDAVASQATESVLNKMSPPSLGSGPMLPVRPTVYR